MCCRLISPKPRRCPQVRNLCNDHRQKALIHKRLEADEAWKRLLLLRGSLLWQQQQQQGRGAEGDAVPLPPLLPALQLHGGGSKGDPIRELDTWIRVQTQECELDVVLEVRGPWGGSRM